MHTDTPHTADPATARQFLRDMYVQARQRFARDRRQLDAAALTRHVEELRRLVFAVAAAAVPGEPAIAGELHDTYSVALDAISAQLAARDLAGAYQLANRLLDVLALELTWMSAL